MRKQQKGLILSSAKGFTLIELLVVIAIIGILSTIVMVSLNTARTKANDAAIRAGLEQVRAVAELFYDAGSTYAGITTANPANMAVIATSIASNGGALVIGVPSSTAYCASSKLKSDDSLYACVDSTGKVVTSSATAICAAAACPN